MVILGIDPGTTLVGYAILESNKSPPLYPHNSPSYQNLVEGLEKLVDKPQVKLLDASLLTIRSPHSHDRLAEIHHGIKALLRKWKPSQVIIEKVFFAKNTKTALAVSEARGVIILTAALAGITVYEYTPLEIKKIVTGDGKADKLQIKKMIGLILPYTKILHARDDVFDAIALALTGHYHIR